MASGATGPVKYAVVNTSTAASNEIVAAVSGKKLRILGLVLLSAGAVDITIEDEDGTDLIGLLPVAAADSALVLPVCELGYQETPAGKALHMLLSGAVQTGGSVVYQEIE